MELYERIKQRRKEIGLSAEQVAERLGVSPATIYRYENKNIKKFPSDILKPLADILMTTPEALIGWDKTDEIKNLVPIKKGKIIPLLGTIACGEPILADENIEEYILLPDELAADFALRCKGDSMINVRIKDGDIVYIHQQPTVDNGEIAAVLIDDEATLKRIFIYKDKIILQAENPKYEPFVYIKEEMQNVTILGKAVGFTSLIC
ncbi:MAG: helix-turn-helix domain-containing protein [Clostridiales bacterium]|nr:helix-turn-helix domain-containing protein [Clostridiales bacterium]